MATNHLDAALRQIQRLFDSGDSDGQLLERFLNVRDESAFAALLRRYGPMVLHVCRRVLPGWHDVEDAFQATFLLLARKADSIRKHDSVASWLHGTAYRLAVQLRRQTARRQQREEQSAPRAPAEPGADVAWRELQAVLDEELERLPEKYRAPILLCYLQGLTHEEAASRLGWPLGTVRGRVARAREALRDRLARRGLSSPSLLLGLSLAVRTVPDGVPPALAAGTLHASLRFAAGEPVAGVASANAAALVEGASSTMKWKLSIALVLFLGAGMTVLVAGAPRSARLPHSASTEEKKAPPASRDAHGDPLPPGARARLGNLRFSPVLSGGRPAVFSPDGKKVACVSFQGEVSVWASADGRLLHHLGRPALGAAGSFASGLVFTPDGNKIFTGHDGSSIALRDLTTGKVLRHFGEGKVPGTSAFAVSPDGTRLAATGRRSEVYVWDVNRGKAIEGFTGHTGLVRCLAFSSDGKRLATGGDDGTTRLWDVATGKEVCQLPESRGDILAVAFSGDGKWLACAGSDGVLRLCEAATGKEQSTGSVPLTGGIRVDLAFTADTKRIALQGNGPLILWDIATGRAVPTPWPTGSAMIRQTLSPDGKQVASVATQTRLELFDAVTGKPLHDFTSHSAPVMAAAVSTRGVVATGGYDRTIRLWDAASGKHLRVLTGHTGPVAQLAFSPDGKFLASAGQHFTDLGVTLWDVASGKQIRYLRGARSPVSSLVFSPDSKELLVVSMSSVSQIRSVPDGKVLREVKGLVGTVVASPDGKYLAASTFAPTTRLQLLDRVKGGEVRSFDTSATPGERFGWMASGLAFTPDGRTLVGLGINGRLALFDVARGTRLRFVGEPIGADAEFRSRSRGPVVRGDGRLSVHIDTGGKVRLFELASGLERASFDSSHGAVWSLAISPDGRTLITGGNDGTALLWDLWALPIPGVKPASSDKELDALWSDLASRDGKRASKAIRALVASDQAALTYLSKHLKPGTPPDRSHLVQLVADLDSDDFAKRKKAEDALVRAGEDARSALESALKKKPALDTTRRIKILLGKLGEASLPGDVLRELRGVEVLETLGTPEARKLLKRLAAGDPATALTTEAKAALARLGR